MTEWPDAGVLLAGVAAGLDPVTLEEVSARAKLMTRVDHKYLVPASVMTRLAGELGDRFGVLEIGGRRQFRYTSTYFDTPDLLTFRQHRQQRRRRFKIRTRTYLDGGGRWLEVKLKGAGGGTDKHRVPYDGAPAHALTPEALDYLSTTLATGLRLPRPASLGPVLSTDYRRVTLVDRSGVARLTCDSGLVCHDGRRALPARRDRVLLESKSADGDAAADRVLRRLGVRPVSVSKYCLGVAALLDVRANPWHRVLRHYFRGRYATPAT
ncbi:polyphosphate polymerase domain-containing protein [Nonomuraea harbinensis]|uniref:Polyphosphate polymerase domain-containing protein n=1 Tax=Nonomuraea harbinensis TaxID=1286938 RepID=A0ABW1BZ81_9ACTN|nr:polyphosphate polymerase domain-containing protein [Nonomuraea harbinensis]